MFRLLKISPPHGWRGVWWELAIVTLGVLVALVAQQSVNAIDRNKDRRFTEAALRDELGLNAIMAFERLTIENCLRSRIAALGAKLSAGGAYWRADPIYVHSATYRAFAMPGAYRTPNRQWSHAAWDTAVSSGVLKTMDRQRVSDLSFIYRQVVELAQLQQTEAQQTPRLSFLAYGQPMDQAMHREALSALAAVDASNRMMVILGEQFLDRVRALNLAFDVDALGGPAMNGARGPKGVIAAQRTYRGSCVKNLPLQL